MQKESKFFVSGYRLLHDGPYTPNNPTADWFDSDKKFSTKREAMKYINSERKRREDYGQKVKFYLREEITKVFSF